MASNRIQCTVGILTLNSASGLPACLDSLKEFAEIIVCDGNSSDATRDIARAAGAKVIKQYDTDVPNIPCVKDKAFVRQRAMEAATNDWYFFMDADDTLSPEVVEEIRAIVSDSSPAHLVYRMPTRIFFEDGDELREIKHEATYPSYQTRLVHRSVGARFKGRVHDRLEFDARRFPVGTMKGYYNFHWPAARVSDFWGYLGRYADWELEVSRPSALGAYLYWGIYRRARTIIGYLAYRLPAMYLAHGTKESMPLRIELTIVRYHAKIFFGEMGKYLSTRRWWIYAREILRGKDTNRILTNIALMDKSCMGSIIDIGGGSKRASHFRFMDITAWHTIATADISPAAKPDFVVDLEREKVPVPDRSFDYVFLMNVLEHLDDRERVLSEIRRILKDGRSDAGRQPSASRAGELVGVIPFMVNVHPDPHDFVRLTEEGLRSLFVACGFSGAIIFPVGVGPFTAGYYQAEFILPRVLRLIVGPFSMALDFLLKAISGRDFTSKFPLSYIFYVSK